MSKSKKRLVPVRRFKEFENSDAWEQRKFSKILFKSDGLRRGPFGSALKKEFFISNSEYTVYEQNNAIYNTWKTRYFITPEKFRELHKFELMPGDFILSGAGTIGRIAQVPSNIIKGVFNQALIRIRINPECMDKSFFLIWMQSESMQRKLTQANPGSAMTNLVPMSEIKKWEIIIPSKAEQNKIGEFIQNINSLIALHQRKLDKLKRVKSAYLTEMFPAEGEREPKRRFPRFTGAWEQRKLGEVAKFYSGGTPSVGVSDYYDGTIPFIRSAEINSTSTELYLSELGLQNSSAKMVHRGDILYALYGATSGEVGISKINGAINQAILAIIPHKGYNSEFLEQWLRKNKEAIIKTYLQGGQGNLSGAIVKQIKVAFPSFDEQQKIGKSFQKIDSLIVLHQRKLDKLKKMKAAYLNEMFV